MSGIHFSTCILPWVSVPVLSKQTVSTLASDSIENKSCTKTFSLVKRMILTAKATDVKTTNPSGIIPTTAAIVYIAASFVFKPNAFFCTKNKQIPKGTIIKEIIRIILSKSVCNCDFACLISFACATIFCDKQSSPTFTAFA